jgi:hypothetical protein
MAAGAAMAGSLVAMAVPAGLSLVVLVGLAGVFVIVKQTTKGRRRDHLEDRRIGSDCWPRRGCVARARVALAPAPTVAPAPGEPSYLRELSGVCSSDSLGLTSRGLSSQSRLAGTALRSHRG